jgi:hypothetical protein
MHCSERAVGWKIYLKYGDAEEERGFLCVLTDGQWWATYADLD